MNVRLSSRYKKSLKTNKCCWSSQIFSGICLKKIIHSIILLLKFNPTAVFFSAIHSLRNLSFHPKIFFPWDNFHNSVPGYHSSSALWPMTRVPTSKFGGSAMKLKEKEAIRQVNLYTQVGQIWHRSLSGYLKNLQSVQAYLSLPTRVLHSKFCNRFSHWGSF